MSLENFINSFGTTSGRSRLLILPNEGEDLHNSPHIKTITIMVFNMQTTNLGCNFCKKLLKSPLVMYSKTINTCNGKVQE